VKDGAVEDRVVADGVVMQRPAGPAVVVGISRLRGAAAFRVAVEDGPPTRPARVLSAPAVPPWGGATGTVGTAAVVGVTILPGVVANGVMAMERPVRSAVAEVAN
ncbi:unnamed protein product, partial [Scytosiphon promiscuus]